MKQNIQQGADHYYAFTTEKNIKFSQGEERRKINSRSGRLTNHQMVYQCSIRSA